MSDHWYALFYQYLVGGAFFLLVIVLSIRSKALDLKSWEGRYTLFILLAGFVIFFTVHSTWIYLVLEK